MNNNENLDVNANEVTKYSKKKKTLIILFSIILVLVAVWLISYFSKSKLERQIQGKWYSKTDADFIVEFRNGRVDYYDWDSTWDKEYKIKGDTIYFYDDYDDSSSEAKVRIENGELHLIYDNGEKVYLRDRSKCDVCD